MDCAASGRGLAARYLAIVPVLAMLATSAAARSEAPGASPSDAAGGEAIAAFAREEPFVKRAFRPFRGRRWIGNAVAYGPYRDGQHPGGPGPTKAELRQDLQLMSKHWGLLRLYGAVGPPEALLEVIREDRLAMKVMLGVWIGAEQRSDADGRIVEELPETKAANRQEIEAAIRLAAAYPNIVIAVSVGNETQVSWSSHRIPPTLLIRYLREVRARTRVPITTVDDFAFWKQRQSRPLAMETDFIVTHLHPLWNGQALEKAVGWTQRTFDEVRAAHPGQTIVIGETGWATQKHNEGEQATLIKGRLGEEEQKEFYEVFSAWTKKERVVTFFFEAFDENWKGGPSPDEVEKHWGLFRADRSPKKAIANGR